MLLFPFLIACASPPDTDVASTAGSGEATATGCGTESSLAYGQIVEYTGEWIPYVDGGEIYCVPITDGASECMVNMRVPDPGAMFMFTVTWKNGDGSVLATEGWATLASKPAGDACFGASGQIPLSAHGHTVRAGDEIRLEAEATEATVTSDDEAIPVDGGQTFRTEVSGFVATSAG